MKYYGAYLTFNPVYFTNEIEKTQRIRKLRESKKDLNERVF